MIYGKRRDGDLRGSLGWNPRFVASRMSPGPFYPGGERRSRTFFDAAMINSLISSSQLNRGSNDKKNYDVIRKFLEKRL